MELVVPDPTDGSIDGPEMDVPDDLIRPDPPGILRYGFGGCGRGELHPVELRK